MIYLITGLPGNGKTLYTLWHVRERAKKEGRPVYYAGIPDLAIPEWIEFTDEQKWHELPAGAIIVIDESQRIFRPRPGRGEPPEHVSKLETHRHNGHDLYLITQHPALIDGAVRRLAGTHRHIVRTFGLSRAVIHEWGEVHMDCEKRRTDSSKTTWNYPRDVYSLYKSAQVHTHKAHLPKQVWYLIGGLVVLGLLGYYITKRTTELTTKSETATAPAAVAATGSPSAFPTQNHDKPKTAVEYAEHLTPRLPGLIHTAPAFDVATRPTHAPYPVGCVQTRSACSCVTQAGIQMVMPDEVCKAFLKSGFHRYWADTISNEAPQ